jgi:hypothetical protein
MLCTDSGDREGRAYSCHRPTRGSDSISAPLVNFGLYPGANGVAELYMPGKAASGLQTVDLRPAKARARENVRKAEEADRDGDGFHGRTLWLGSARLPLSFRPFTAVAA